ncbi:uncharacterized protein TA18365 [Theileria annulata]|uniref:Uncharacterized protein n=1 Tax=Theileria annulata TaxID=5874 RepID=Q4UAY0_THEAN|nr:uncharacterized protein TA18365 [Theileria annulata]CAI76021.1 hypothetical protein TA18365 [Theileria annulata]|eukprot:XP_955497.1 hypothetical protein TA18365 [Theileria annulata]
MTSEQTLPLFFDDNLLKTDKRFVTFFHVEEPDLEHGGSNTLFSFLFFVPRLGTKFSKFVSNVFPNTEENIRLEDHELLMEFVGFSDRKDWCATGLTLWTPNGVKRRFYFHLKDETGELKVLSLSSLDEMVNHTRQHVKPEVFHSLKDKLPAHEYTHKLLESFKHFV